MASPEREEIGKTQEKGNAQLEREKRELVKDSLDE